MTMATRIVVMKDGLIQQVDTPQNLYDFPANTFVAGFIGTPQMNFIDAKVEKKGADVYVVFGKNEIKLPAEKAQDPALADYIGKEVIVGIRPECLKDEPVAISSMPDSVIDAHVDVTELMGAEIYLYVSTDGLDPHTPQNLIARVSPRAVARTGDDIKLALDVARIHIFDKDTEKCVLH
jgi:multiple sugar transport system ATP-binding protein